MLNARNFSAIAGCDDDATTSAAAFLASRPELLMHVSRRTIMASALSVLTTTVFTPVVSSAASHDVKVFKAPTSNSYPESVTVGPDGVVWFTEKRANKIGRLSRGGQITELSVPTSNSRPQGIVIGSGGDVWFTESNGNKIGRIAPSGKVTEYPLATPNSNPFGIATGPDGDLWFTLSGTNRIGRITTSGKLSEFPLDTTTTPYGIALGPDGNLWFTGFTSNTVGRITPGGHVTEFPIPTPDSMPFNIVAGADGALRFTQPNINAIGQITTDGHMTEHPLPPAKYSTAAERRPGRINPVGTSGYPYGITATKDGSLFYTLHTGRAIGKLGLGGKVTEYKLADIPILNGIATGPDGTLWFAAPHSDAIGKISTNVVTQ